jgi:hypothetical protein
MAALEAATQSARVTRADEDSLRTLTRAGWVAGSSPAMTQFFEIPFVSAPPTDDGD